MPLASFQQGRPSEAMVHAGQTPSTPSAGDRSTSVVLPVWTDDCDGPTEWPGTAGAVLRRHWPCRRVRQLPAPDSLRG